MRHVEVVTRHLGKEAPLLDVARDQMIAEFAIEYLVEEIHNFGKQPPGAENPF